MEKDRRARRPSPEVPISWESPPCPSKSVERKSYPLANQVSYAANFELLVFSCSGRSSSLYFAATQCAIEQILFSRSEGARCAFRQRA